MFEKFHVKFPAQVSAEPISPGVAIGHDGRDFAMDKLNARGLHPQKYIIILTLGQMYIEWELLKQGSAGKPRAGIYAAAIQEKKVAQRLIPSP
jgi:hypothetical protein